MYSTKGNEVKTNIVKLVEEHETKNGISKNEAAIILITRHGGSRATYWKYFNELLAEGQIELRNVTKQQQRLFTTLKNRKINEFREKIKHVENLLELLDKDLVTGDCFSWHVTDQIPLDGYHMRELELWKQVIGYTKEFERFDGAPNAFCLQARYDIIKNLPSFLVNYINDPQNEFSDSVKDECMKIIYSVMTRCFQMLQRDYTNSPYYSNQFYDNHKINTRISLVRGLPLPDLQAEFLRIIGRYYFLISKNYSKNGAIDSCDEQRIISRFVQNFFPKSKIPNDKMSESITVDHIVEYWLDNQKPRRKFFKSGMIERLDEVHKALGGKLAKKFDRYGNNDPFIVANYYNEWIFSLGLFSLLEKRIIETYLDETEKYEKESKTMDHNDPLEALDYSGWRDFKGHLYKTSDGKAKIILNLPYSEVIPHLGRWMMVLTEK
ncbi:MAG: hypothetical protein ACREAD_01810 [Nitrosopumilaceae archaeon]